VSLADAIETEAQAPGRDGPAPAEGSWGKGRAARKAELEELAAQRRRSMLARVPPAGISRVRLASKLAQEIDSSWRTGTGAALTDLYARGEAHEVDGVVHRGPGPQQQGRARLAPAAADPAEVRARVLALARTRPYWFRRELLGSVTVGALDQIAAAIQGLVADGELEQIDGSRVRVRPEPAPSPPAPVAPRQEEVRDAADRGLDAAAGVDPAEEREAGPGDDVPVAGGGDGPDGVGERVAGWDHLGLVGRDGDAGADPARPVEQPEPGAAASGGEGAPEAAGPEPVARAARVWGRRGSSPRRDQVVAVVLEHPKGIAPREVAALIGTEVSQAAAALQAAERLGLVRRTGSTLSVRYWPPKRTAQPLPSTSSTAESGADRATRSTPDQEARGRTATAGAASAAGAPDAPSGSPPPPEPAPAPRTGSEAREVGGTRPTEIDANLFNRVVEQNAKLAELQADRDGWEDLAEERAAELHQVRATLDRLRVPTGALLWRLGWLEGRLGPETGR
jgi:hypothetical protein